MGGMMHHFTPTLRTRNTPFTDRVQAAGVRGYTVYNRMKLATYFRSVQEDYAHLKSAVQVWDVSAERQVEIAGPDAERLIQMTTPRNLAKMAEDQCYYIPNVGVDGLMLNDPVLNKIAPDRYWVSLADSDMLLYYKGLAAGLNLNVKIFEPDVHPLAIQGPKSEELVRRVWGDAAASIKFFRHTTVDFQGIPMILARSGWSCQGGFELYVVGWENGAKIWDILMEAGADLDVHAGCPNGIERIEGGLLSFGSDMTMENSPFEAGLGKYCHDTPNCLGHAALQELNPPHRQIRPVEIPGEPVAACAKQWEIYSKSGSYAGTMRSAAYSPDFQTNVCIGMIEDTFWDAGTELVVKTPEGTRGAIVKGSFWL